MGKQADVTSTSLGAAATGSAGQLSGSGYLKFKRLLDLLLVLFIAPAALVVLTILAMFVWLADRSPPFYAQYRVGQNGRQFRMIKLRTMVRNADQVLEEYLENNAAARREWDQTQKLKHDPRIIRFGRFLRKTSLDELPQLWNVLSGDMSLVGPRPMMVEQTKLYPGKAYYRLRPGLTGPWQVSDRNRSTFADRAAFDDQYYRTASLGLDLALLIMTFGRVISPSYGLSSSTAETSGKAVSGIQDEVLASFAQEEILRAQFEGILRQYRSEIEKYQSTLDKLKASNSAALEKFGSELEI